MHQGLIVIGVKGLTRKGLGTMFLVVIRDLRFKDSNRNVSGIAEVDVNNGGGIVYFSPNFLIGIEDFKKIKVEIQTHGYEGMDGKNLLIYIGFLAKLFVSGPTKFNIKIKDIVGLLQGKHIRVMKPLGVDSIQTAGLEWKLDHGEHSKRINYKPKKNTFYIDSEGRTSIRFSDYTYENRGDTKLKVGSDEVNLMSIIEEIIEKVNNVEKVLFLKELEMNLKQEELQELEDMLYRKGDIREDEELSVI